jgi:hypothetical protein
MGIVNIADGPPYPIIIAISAARSSLDLVTEAQAWDFSLREVARRAGVSHNAPHNHFAEKRDLLGILANRNRTRSLSGTQGRGSHRSGA